MFDNRLELFQICNNFQCEQVYGILLLLDICSISLKSIHFQPINFQVISLLSFDQFERTFTRFSVLRDVGAETQLKTGGGGDIGSDLQKGVYIAPSTKKLS